MLCSAFLFRQRCIISDENLRKEFFEMEENIKSDVSLFGIDDANDSNLSEVEQCDVEISFEDCSSTHDLSANQKLQNLSTDINDENNTSLKNNSEILPSTIKDNVEASENKKETQIINAKMINNRLLIHKCPECNKGFDRADKMLRHARIHDVPENKFLCNYCNRGYKLLQTYKTHMKSHDPNNTNKCSFCNNAFATHYELERHVRVHTGERPFSCEECGKGFAQRNGLVVRNLILSS